MKIRKQLTLLVVTTLMLMPVTGLQATEISTDIAAPKVESVYISGLKENDSYCSVTVIATDNLSDNLQYSLDGENWQYSNNFKITQDGYYTFHVKDEASNITKTSRIISEFAKAQS